MGFMLSFYDHNCKDRNIAGSDIRTDRVGLYCWSERGAKPGVGRIEIEVTTGQTQKTSQWEKST